MLINRRAEMVETTAAWACLKRRAAPYRTLILLVEMARLLLQEQQSWCLSWVWFGLTFPELPQMNRKSTDQPVAWSLFSCEHQRRNARDFPEGPVVKNPSANAGDMRSIPGKIPHASGQLSNVPQLLSHSRVSELWLLCPRACALQQEKPLQWETHPPHL